MVVITFFPSHTIRPSVNKFRSPYRLLPALGVLAMMILGKCTYSTVTPGGLLQLPTLVYWGFEPSLFLFNCGVALWSIAALVFITPWWAATNILIVGGINLGLLTIIDGTVRLVSKLCFYCLLLSVLWLLEPLWTPAPARPSEAEDGYLPCVQADEQLEMCENSQKVVPPLTSIGSLKQI